MKPYPKKMKGTRGTVVLFESEKIGVVIKKGDSHHKVGYKSKTWVPKNFKDFEIKTIKPRKLNINK